MPKPKTPEEMLRVKKFHAAGMQFFQSGKTALDAFAKCEQLQDDDMATMGFVLGFVDGFISNVRRIK